VRILITGNRGYIGTVLGEYLFTRGFEVSGLDSGFFESCVLEEPTFEIPTNVKDIRDVILKDFEGFDAVVHLAALSNDPIGELDETLTYEINRDAAIRAAELARSAKVKRFIFISTQSIYGISRSDLELTENADKNPQTAYARSKWDAENAILQMSSNDYTTLALRPSTVFGWSSRLRSDIVFNNLLLSGLSKGQIKVHSDGSPWRPIVHVTDLSEAIRLALIADHSKVSGQPFNIGKIGGNYTVKEIAEAASKCLNGMSILFNTESVADPRSYKVSFLKALSILEFEAKRELVESGSEMLTYFENMELDKNLVMGRLTNRLSQVAYLRNEGILDESLRFN
jgi:nucleoside-diphosphate-sugar epimerase